MTPDRVWCGIASGDLIDLSKPNVKDIFLYDIAWSLSHMIRFNGHLEYPITVARHSIYVAELLQGPLKFAGLLHDAAEAYLGDMTRPMKLYLRLSGVDVENLERVWRHAIWQKFGCLPMTPADENKITEADDLQLAREIASYAAEGPFRRKGEADLDRSGYGQISLLLPHPLNPEEDRELFEEKFYEYYTLDRQRNSV